VLNKNPNPQRERRFCFVLIFSCCYTPRMFTQKQNIDTAAAAENVMISEMMEKAENTAKYC
jgi:hypothetical protein